MKQTPFFSILVPIYNVEPFLAECVHSVLNQTDTNWELILVDDGSTDGSGALADRFAQQCPDKIRVYHEPNRGVVAARQTAISKATGQVCVFMDSDDTFATPHALERLHQKFSQYDCDCIIYGMVRVEEGRVTPFGTIEKEELVTDRRALYRKLFLDNKFNMITRKAIKTRLLGTWDFTPFYHIFIEEDLLQSLEFLQNSQHFLLLPDVLYHYRANPNGATGGIKKRPLNVSLEVRERVLGFLKNSGVFTAQDMQDYHRYCIWLFEQEIKRICRHPAEEREKIALFKRLRQTPYFTDFLDNPAYPKPFSTVHTLYRRERYRLLLRVVALWDFCRGQK